MKDYDQIIQTAVSNLGFSAFADFYDAEADYYDGNKKLPKLTEWITYNRVTEAVSTYADDADEITAISYDVHVFYKNKSQTNTYRRQLKAALRAAELTITNTQYIYESDTEMNHVVVSISDSIFLMEE